jgi:hypothetical protein
MKLAIMQPYFFPYIGYLQLIKSVDTFIFYGHVSFIKKSWITRNRILDKGKGIPVYINVPVIGQSSNKLIKDLSIDNNSKWKKKVLDLLYFNYKKAKYFNEIYPFIEGLIAINEDNLHKYNSITIIKICALLDIKTNLIFEEPNADNIEFELKNTPEILKEKVKSERILKLCKKYNASSYVNSIGGRELYDKKYFLNNDSEIFFVKTEDYKYKQFNEFFTNHLSIIDILMHEGVEKTKEFVKKYKLV